MHALHAQGVETQALLTRALAAQGAQATALAERATQVAHEAKTGRQRIAQTESLRLEGLITLEHGLQALQAGFNSACAAVHHDDTQSSEVAARARADLQDLEGRLAEVEAQAAEQQQLQQAQWQQLQQRHAEELSSLRETHDSERQVLLDEVPLLEASPIDLTRLSPSLHFVPTILHSTPSLCSTQFKSVRLNSTQINSIQRNATQIPALGSRCPAHSLRIQVFADRGVV